MSRQEKRHSIELSMIDCIHRAEKKISDLQSLWEKEDEEIESKLRELKSYRRKLARDMKRDIEREKHGIAQCRAYLGEGGKVDG